MSKLREVSLNLQRVDSLGSKLALQGLARRVAAAFDAQIGSGDYGTGYVRKINVDLFIDEASPEGLEKVVPDPRDSIIHTGLSMNTEELIGYDADMAAAVLYERYMKALIMLAERHMWNAEAFLAAAESGRKQGIMARVHREKYNRSRTHIALVDGHVSEDATHMAFRIEETAGGRIVARDERRLRGDYWDMAGAASDVVWIGSTASVRSKKSSLSNPIKWQLFVATQ